MYSARGATANNVGSLRVWYQQAGEFLLLGGGTMFNSDIGEDDEVDIAVGGDVR